MKKIAFETNKKPTDKMKLFQQLIEDMQKAKHFSAWGIGLEKYAHTVNGDKLSAGNLIMGNNRQIPLDRVGMNIDRDT